MAEYSDRLDQPSSFMHINENVTHLLDRAVDDGRYPMQVNVSVEIEPPEARGQCEYNDCEKDAESVIYFDELDMVQDLCAGHAGITVQRHDDAVALNGSADTDKDRREMREEK